MSDLDRILAHLDGDLDAALERLFALVRTKSISTDPAYKEECVKAADWLVTDLSKIGFDAEAVQTEGHPIVLARGGEGAPHVVFYGHYDVQPVDPIELWDHDPFEPAVRTRADGIKIITGRGTSDDKGQVMTFLEACRAWHAVTGTLPCRITMLIEGEEESGGKSLKTFLKTRGGEIGADLALVCDTTMWNRQTPAITTQLRGNVTEELTVKAANRDLHSGVYGNAAANANTVLVNALAGLRDAEGRVTVPGFYDGVPELPDAIRAQWETLGFDQSQFLGDVGLSIKAGEQDRSALEQVWARPSCEINGIWGGYTGAGFKTVIPAEAHAKVSFRLVGTQDPKAIREAFRAYIRAAIPEDCTVEFTAHGDGKATTMPTDSPAFEAARRALSEEWGTEAAFIGAGGSIPVVSQFQEHLGLHSMLIGFGLEDDALHSPNEKYDLASFTKGARAWVRVLGALAQQG